MPTWVIFRLKELGRIVRYLYFLRFSLTLWLFPWILTLLNETHARTLVSGIVTPEHEPQFICVAFFVVSSSFVALIAARVVVINGNERFGTEPPPFLHALLVSNHRFRGWLLESLTVLLAQLPSFYVFRYLITNGKYEHVYRTAPGNEPLYGILWGTVLAAVFWWIINAIFYTTYELPADAVPPNTVQLGQTAARTILFPRWCFWLVPQGRPISLDTLEGVQSPLRRNAPQRLFTRLQRLLFPIIGEDGYLYAAGGRLYEAHALSIPAVVGSILLYIAMCPLTAPVPVLAWARAFFIIFLLLPGLVMILLFWWCRSPVHGYGLLKWKLLFTLGVVGFLGSIIYLYRNTDPERFPAFALILIMAIAVFWTFSVFAFYADRYRVPVLTTVLVFMLIPRLAHWDKGKEEHYISTATARSNTQLLSPQQVLDNLRSTYPDKPVIIVTSTGGGLHASAWTASVLSKLEETFGDATPFHEHLLLVSTVSGGSVGLLTYLNQIQSVQKGHALDPVKSANMISAAQCSSLEAITWGLVYYDLPKAFLPLIPYFIDPSNGNAVGGVSDLDKSPLLKDRTWALRKGLARNLQSGYCRLDSDKAEPSNLNTDIAATTGIETGERTLSLANLLHAGIDPRIPAFTMNTTSVEGGTRFLLANYKVPVDSVTGANESYPAQSFLDKYRLDANQNVSADLPLATAAQLSATFPYVSSAARIPTDISPSGLHFVDGGYYDNDGTASAIEFLRSALEKPTKPEPALRVIVIEIRNSGDPQSDRPAESTGRWNLLDQITAPLNTFWNAGHESVTERNRVGLDLFEKAYVGKVEIRRIVFADQCAQDTVRTDPLNWSLTPWQRYEVQTSAASLQSNYNLARAWFLHFDEEWNASQSQTAQGSAGSACPTK